MKNAIKYKKMININQCDTMRDLQKKIYYNNVINDINHVENYYIWTFKRLFTWK